MGIGLRCAAGFLFRDPPLPGALARALPTEVRHHSSSLSSERPEGHPGSHGGCAQGVPSGDLDGFYAPLVVDDSALDRGPPDGATRRHRLRDRFAGSVRRAHAATLCSLWLRTLARAAAFAGEYFRLWWRPTSALRSRRVRTALRRDFRKLERGRLSGFARLPGAAVSAIVRSSASFLRARPRCSSCSRSRSSGFEALGWPMAKGRDTWDYLVYYLQLTRIRRSPRAPAVPDAAPHPSSCGIPLCRSAAARSWRPSSAPVRVTILAWSATAHFGRIPALFTAGFCSSTPAFATLYHQASSDAVFATGSRSGRSSLRARCGRRRGWRFVALGAGFAALVLIGRRIRYSCRSRSCHCSCCRLEPENRVVGCLRSSARSAPRGWALHNGVRYDDATVARGGRAGAVPHRVHGQPDDRPGERGKRKSRSLPRLIEDEAGSRRIRTRASRSARRVPRERFELRDRAAHRAL